MRWQACIDRLTDNQRKGDFRLNSQQRKYSASDSARQYFSCTLRYGDGRQDVSNETKNDEWGQKR